MKSIKLPLVIFTLTTAFPFAFVGYFYFSSAGEVVVTKQGEIVGPFNKVRAQLQGSNFWREQLHEAKRALEWRRGAPERSAKRQARIDASLEESKQRMDKFYDQHPKAKPTAATEQAEVLRERADEIEQAEFDEHSERLRLKKMSELETIIQVIEARAP